MEEGKIEMITVESLLELSKAKEDTKKPKYTFFIPGYQRGYRWTETEVLQLLNDIKEFTEDENSKLYCLQPIVIKKIEHTDERVQGRKIEGEYIFELIDGQQRLTTIYLILKWLNSRYKEDYQKQLFQILFETREDSEYYLKTIDIAEKDSNIDYHFIYRAYNCIGKWFSDLTHNQQHLGELETDILKNVKPIWYEIPKESKAVEVFRALNVGKIRLTNFELIKALFLSKVTGSKNNSELFEIAYDWELISKALMNDSFWNFISNTKIEKFQRIEYLFEIEALSFDDDSISADEKLRTFILFQNRLKKASRIEVWKNFKQLFLILQSWYEDRELHHLIGYLIAEKKDNKGLEKSIKQLRDKSLKIGTEEFNTHINSEIKSTLKTPLEIAKHGKDNLTIRNALLLFNIATLLEDKNSNVFFNFSEFKDKNWDIEHIKSVSTKKPAKRDEQLKWLAGVLWYMTGLKIETVSIETIEKELEDEEKGICLTLFKLYESKPINDIEFSDIYDKVLNKFNEYVDEEVDNSLANLTLLDSATNRSYGNSIFPVKRKTIIELETKGGFVPVCTKNVFLKLYNEKASNHFIWSSDDAYKYKSIIISKVNNLLKDKENERA